jgi:hypothetical protein
MAGCAQGHCRRQSTPPGEAQPLESAPISTRADKLTASDRVLVYKYDGGAQCGQGRVRTPDQMAKDLKDIPILSVQKRNDGLQHIQVCGQATGMANVYEISAKYLSAAEAKGFKRWTFESE